MCEIETMELGILHPAALSLMLWLAFLKPTSTLDQNKNHKKLVERMLLQIYS